MAQAMTGIVQRLREHDGNLGVLVEEAADEIERLQVLMRVLEGGELRAKVKRQQKLIQLYEDERIAGLKGIGSQAEHVWVFQPPPGERAEIERLRANENAQRDGALALIIAGTNQAAEVERLRAALADLVEAVTAEVNEKGGSGYILARLSDACAALEVKS